MNSNIIDRTVIGDKIRKADDFRQILEEHDCIAFGFFKEEDGSYRIMKATLNPDIINANYTFSGDYEYDMEKQVRFWDVELNDWRSCIFKNLIRTSLRVVDKDENSWSKIYGLCCDARDDFAEKYIAEPGQTTGFYFKKK